MKQVVAGLTILVVVVAGISWATLRSSSAQEQDPPTETTVRQGDGGGLEDFDFSFDQFVECLRDQGVDPPTFEESEGRFGFHFEFGTDDLEGLKEAHEACSELLPFERDGLPFRGEFFDRDDFPFGGHHHGFLFRDEFPFGGRFGGSFGLGLGGLDLDELAECLAELGTFENVDQVRAQLDECLPAPPDFESGIEELEEWLQEQGLDGEGFPFGEGFRFFEGPGPFGFDFDFDFDGEFDFDFHESPDLDEQDSLEGAAA